MIDQTTATMSEEKINRLESQRHTAIRSVISFVLVLGILLVGVGVSVVLFLTGPDVDESADERVLPPVETKVV